jgi:DNA mismatch endonuclease (patch repair protein)
MLEQSDGASALNDDAAREPLLNPRGLRLDRVDKITRSRMMAAASGHRDTGPELLLRHHLYRAGVRGYRLYRRDVLGKPDLCWIGRQVAVFVDGAFWHGHPSAFKAGKSGPFWDSKIQGNIERDRKVDAHLRSSGWTVIRLWDFEIEKNAADCVACIQAALRESGFRH